MSDGYTYTDADYDNGSINDMTSVERLAGLGLGAVVVIERPTNLAARGGKVTVTVAMKASPDEFLLVGKARPMTSAALFRTAVDCGYTLYLLY